MWGNVLKQFLSFLLMLGIALTTATAEVNFSGLDLSNSNTMLFDAAVDVPDYGNYSTLLSAELPSGKLHQLTYFPEQITLLANTGQLQIQNRFGVFRSNANLTSFNPVANFPSFVNGSTIRTGKISPMKNSPDGRFLVYLDATTPAFSRLQLFDSSTGKTTTIASNVALSLQGPPVAWSPQSDYFIYAKNGTLYYYSVAQLLEGRVLSEDLRVIGKGSIADVVWGMNDDIYYLYGSLVYHVLSAEFFTRSLYESLLGVGTIVGRIPFTFDPNFDRFWISPSGDKILLDKGGSNVFLYFLQPDDYLSTGSMVSLPYLYLPRSSRIEQVVWTVGGGITILTRHIEGGNLGSAIYRLDLSKPTGPFVFARTEDTDVTNMALDTASPSYIALLSPNGVTLKDYASWRTVRTITHPDPLHILWTGNGNLVIAGRYYIELVDISSAESVGTGRGGSSRFIAFSQAQNYGFATQAVEGIPNVEVSTRGIVREVNLGSADSEWRSVDTFSVTPHSTASDQYRVYVEPLTSRSYQNVVMVRNLLGVNTTTLFQPPSPTYAAFPATDEPVDMTDFSHGSRIRRREVSIVFNAIGGVDGLTQVLNVLKEYNVHATFFVNGDFIRQHPDAVKEIANSGQEVGSLFFSYFNMTDSRYGIDTNFIEQGLARTEDEYYQATGKELSRLWHAPFYFVSPDVLAATRDLHYTYVGRDVDSLDWVPAHDDNGLARLYQPSADLLERVMDKVKPGSIVSMTLGKPEENLASTGEFVGGRNDYLFQKLDVLLNALIERGYSEVTVSTLRDHSR